MIIHAVTKACVALHLGCRKNLLVVVGCRERKKVENPSYKYLTINLYFSSFVYFFLQILGVLSQDGIARFVDLNTCQILFQLVPPVESDKLTSICLSAHGGDFIIATTEAGRFVIYSIKSLCPNFNQVCVNLFKNLMKLILELLILLLLI